MRKLFRAVATRLDISCSASGGRSWQHPAYNLDLAAGSDEEFSVAGDGLLLTGDKKAGSALHLMP